MTARTSSIERAPSISAMRLRLSAEAENVMLVRQAVDGAAREIGASLDVINDLKLAVTEACSNVVKYAYRDDSGEMEICVDPGDNGFRVVIRDQGEWLERVSENGDAGGLGIPLMEAVTRSCNIDSDGQGTTVTLEFPLEREDARVEANTGDV